MTQSLSSFALFGIVFPDPFLIAGPLVVAVACPLLAVTVDDLTVVVVFEGMVLIGFLVDCFILYACFLAFTTSGSSCLVVLIYFFYSGII